MMIKTLSGQSNLKEKKTFYIRGLTVDGDENVYITGNFYGTFDFDPGADVFEMTAESVKDGVYREVERIR